MLSGNRFSCGKALWCDSWWTAFALRCLKSDISMSTMVFLLTFTYLLLLLLNASVSDASLMHCTCFSLELVCLLWNHGNKFKAELSIHEKVSGLLAKETKNLCSLGSATYNCLKLPPVKL